MGLTRPASIKGRATAMGMMPNSVPPAGVATLCTACAGPLNCTCFISCFLPPVFIIKYSNVIRCAPDPTATNTGCVVVRNRAANSSGVFTALVAAATSTSGLLPIVITSSKLLYSYFLMLRCQISCVTYRLMWLKAAMVCPSGSTVIK